MTLDVYTVGGLPWISQALKGIVLILGDSAYHTALKVTLLWAMVIGTIMAVRKTSIYPLSHLIISFFLFHGFYSAKVDINIIDTKLGQNYVVTDVPFGVGVVTSMFSMLGHTLSNLIDTAFHTGTVVVYGVNNSYISDIDYEKTGYLGTLDYFTRVKDIAFGDSEAFRRIMAYTEQCFIPYVSTLNESELDDILRERDLFGSGKLEIPLNLIMNYDGQSWYCKEFYTNMVVPKINEFLSNTVSTPSLIGFTSYEELQRYRTVINALTNGSYSVTSAVSQPAVINAIKTALVSFSSDSDEFNREILSSYLVGEAEGKFKLMAKALGDLAKDLIPSLAIAMQFLVIVASSTIALLFLLPQAQNAFWRYVKLSAWIYFWSPALATLDALTKVGAIYKLHSVLLLTNTSGLTIASVGKLLAEADKVSAIGGYLALSVPGIAWLLLQGSEYVVASLAQGIMGRATQGVTPEEMIKASTAEKVGYETTGTIGEGFRVRSALFANPTSMAHAFGSAVAGASSSVLQGSYLGGIADASIKAGAGTATYNAHGGSISGMERTGALTQGVKAYATDAGIMVQRPNLDGSIASQTLREKWGGNLFSGHFNEAYKKVLSEKLSQTYQELQNLTTENAKSSQAGYREFAKFEDAVLNQYRDGAEYTEVLETSETESLKEMQQLRDSLAEALGIDKQTATKITNDLAAKLSFDANFGKTFIDTVKKGNFRKILDLIGPGLEDKIDVSKVNIATLTKTAKDLAEFAKSKGYEKVLSALNKISRNDTIGHSIVSGYQNQTGESVDLSKVRSYSERIASSLHKATAYEQQEQGFKEKGMSYAVKLEQAIVDWFANKHNMASEDAHAFLNNLAVKDPGALEKVIEEFADDYAKNYRIDKSEVSDIVKNVQERLKNANQGLSQRPQDFYSQEKSKIEEKAHLHGVDKSLHQELQGSYNFKEQEFKQKLGATKEKIHTQSEEISPNALPTWTQLYNRTLPLAPDNAVSMLHSNRLELLWNEVKDEKFILGGTVAANADLVYEWAKKGWPYVSSAGMRMASGIGRVAGAVGGGTLALALGGDLALLYTLKLAHDKVNETRIEKLNQAVQSEEKVSFDSPEKLEQLPTHLKGRYLSEANFHSYKEYEEAIEKELSPIEKVAYGKAVGEVESQWGKFMFTATDAEWEGGYHSPTYSVMWIHNGKSEVLTGLKTNELIQLIKEGKIKN